MNNQTQRQIKLISQGMPATDGDGVKLTRIIGTPQLDMLDPFLLLDVFESDQPQDYIGGFPKHPHRGFETVSYLLAGNMRHKDSAGNEGVITPGGVQWMTAGKGIEHSEMPEQVEGLLKGFQLWVNLPSHAKMVEPGYQEFPPEQVAVETWPSGTSIRVISGTTAQGTVGPVKNHYVSPTYMDVQLKAGDVFEQSLPNTDNAFIYVISGTAAIDQSGEEVATAELAILTAGDYVRIRAQVDSRFLLVSGKPINEPVARGGPFVMNTKAEVLQAFADYQSGQF
ncbi:pirin family protein [Reinekea sp.]|jgi:redox-sensitive bicupin YhaK (pirin superfamily)|uniref:pirin family protein n=1 Tax=Reinekea sp. TaxID=1970455 RepID=UPI003988DB79